MRDPQNISSLTVIVEDQGMVFPKRRSMRDSQQSNSELRRMLHHPALHLQRNQGGSFVEHSILAIYQ
jgi:hypothetical protein